MGSREFQNLKEGYIPYPLLFRIPQSHYDYENTVVFLSPLIIHLITMALYHIETYGCTANQGESKLIEQLLRDAGHHKVENPEYADVAILNTCTVIEKTEQTMLSRARELEPLVSDLIITGCLALAQPDLINESGINARVCGWDEVPMAVGNGECPTTTRDTLPIIDGVIGILPIARGCMSDCSYCITKKATGKIESPSIEENISKAQNLIKAGAKEIRVTGQDTGVYGWDLGERLLDQLLDEICELPGDFRVRLGMANPKGVHGICESLANVFSKHEKLYDFIHAPVQSGSNTVLGHMRRQHQVNEFKDIVSIFNRHLDHWTLATDFIVGFPTETTEDHQQSLNLIREVQPERINITRFSKRPGTDAAKLKGLGGTLKKQRSSEMTQLKLEITSQAYRSMIGTRHTLLAVEPGTNGSMKCRDEAYRQVIIKDFEDYGITPGTFIPSQIVSSEHVYAFAEPV
jgi:threonylcarbamoyladenosine tRNA methylthiotransferase CDKAL1